MEVEVHATFKATIHGATLLPATLGNMLPKNIKSNIGDTTGMQY